MKLAISIWFQKGPTEDQKGEPPQKNTTTLNEVRPTTSARKYKYMETRTTGTTGGGRKCKGN